MCTRASRRSSTHIAKASFDRAAGRPAAQLSLHGRPTRHRAAPAVANGPPPPPHSQARSRSSRLSTPSRTPSERVTTIRVRFSSRIRRATSSRRALGRIVLGPSAIAVSAGTACRRRSAARPSRPRTTRCSFVTTQICQLRATRSATSVTSSSGAHVGASVRTKLPTRVRLSASPSSASPNEPQSAFPAT